MNALQMPRIKSYEVLRSDNDISVVFEENGEPLVFSKDRLPLLQLMDGTRGIKNIWDELQLQQSSLRLSEIYLTLEKLKKAGALEGAAENAYFSKSLLDSAIFRLKICNTSESSLQSRQVFFALSGAILLFSLLSVPLLYMKLPVHGFLELNSSFAFALPLVIFIFSILGLIKGVLKAVLVALASGTWPGMTLCYRGFMFDIEINEAPVLIAQPDIRRLYQLTKSFCFLFIGIALASLIKTDFARQVQITALMMTFIWLNPLRKSEFTQAVSSFFSEDEMRHVIPFLRNKALTVFAKKSRNPASEKKLLIFSSLSLVWFFSFFNFAQNLILSSYGFWYSTLTMGSPAEKTSAALLMISLLGLTFSLLVDLLKTFSLNIFSGFSKSFKKILQKQKPKDSAGFDKVKLAEFLSALSFFSDLEPASLNELCSVISLRSFPKGTPIVLEGDIGREMFVLVQGRARVEKETESGYRQLFATLEAGAIFGEIALIEKCRRTADVMAETDLVLAIITEEQFSAFFEKDSSNAARALKNKISFSRFLANSTVFRGLPMEISQLFIQKGSFENFRAHTKIVQQGSFDKDFYLLLEGKVIVLRDGEPVAELSHGDFFGEIALFQNSPRTADVNTLEDSLLLRLDKDSFWEVLSNNMDLTFNLEFAAQSRIGAENAG